MAFRQSLESLFDTTDFIFLPLSEVIGEPRLSKEMVEIFLVTLFSSSRRLDSASFCAMSLLLSSAYPSSAMIGFSLSPRRPLPFNEKMRRCLTGRDM